MTSPVLAARDLAWRVGRRRILGPLDLTIRRGECVAIVGPNGAGKTTLLRLLSGLLAATGGSIELEGRSLASVPRRDVARRMAYVPQLRPQRVPLTVRELVTLGRYPYLGRWQFAPSSEDRRAVERALGRVGIRELGERPLPELSGGERQVAFLAAALAQEAETLILDEPTAHLDAAHVRLTAELLRREHREAGRTLVLATHDLHLASALGDRLVALRAGRILAEGTPSALLDRELLAALFDAPFRVVRAGERPLVTLELEGPAARGPGGGA